MGGRPCAKRSALVLRAFTMAAGVSGSVGLSARIPSSRAFTVLEGTEEARDMLAARAMVTKERKQDIFEN